jgi:hypothetical protein
MLAYSLGPGLRVSMYTCVNRADMLVLAKEELLTFGEDLLRILQKRSSFADNLGLSKVL